MIGFVGSDRQLASEPLSHGRQTAGRCGARRGLGCTDIVQRGTFTHAIRGLGPLALALSLLHGPAAAQAPLPDRPRRDAAGWLQLEADQRAYRERVEPLDLREERDLEIIERRQDNDLRALQQQQRRELEQDQRMLRLRRGQVDEGFAPPPPRQGTTTYEDRRAYERQRLDRQLEQRRLPFGAADPAGE